MVTLRLVAALFFVALALVAGPAHARPWERDLGPIPTTGVEAAETLPARQRLVIAELACGDEAHFLAKTRGPGDNQPLMHLVAKAAALSGALSPNFECRIVQRFDANDWDIELRSTPATRTIWRSTQIDIENLDGGFHSGAYDAALAQALATAIADRIERDLNALAAEVYGPPCAQVVNDVLAVARPSTAGSTGHFDYYVEFALSGGCLERQINYVVSARKLHRHGNPGTSGLPCVSRFGDAGPGDWDMAVAQLTRVTFLLRQVDAGGRLSAEGQASLDKLQGRLLTLSRGPAQEVYNLIFDCGNFDNGYGSARDRLDDEDFYDPDLERTVAGDEEGDSTFWEDLLSFLVFLALLAALAGLAIGLAALGALGATLAAAIVIIAAATGALQAILGLVFFGGIEETENHLLMQNTSKYLKNKMLMEECYADGDDDCVEDYEDYNEDLREWLMERLQRITREDFAEYNAKPYGRLSVTAILNLHDFACDAGYRTVDPAAVWPQQCSTEDSRLVTAAASVLDLTATKMALGSNQGRRFPPYRRLAHANTSFAIGRLPRNGPRSAPYRILDFGETADHMPAAMQLWAGQTFHGPGGHASASSLDEMAWHATSRYRPHAMILDLALDKSTPYEQTYRHGGWERYSSGPGWLLTAGGTTTEPAQGFRWPFGVATGGVVGAFIKDTDNGSGVPTTLMVANGRRVSARRADPPAPRASGDQADRLVDFIRFEGRLRTWPADVGDTVVDEPRSYENNFCVTGSFACGINMHIPQALLDPYEVRLPDGTAAQEQCAVLTSDGLATPTGHQFFTIDSSACRYWDDGDAANDFIAVVYRQQCGRTTPGCARPSYWGFVEIVPKSAWPDRDALVAQLLADNGENFLVMARSGGTGELTYESAANGVLRFAPAGSYLTAIDGSEVDGGDEPDWPRAEGIVQSDDDNDERFTITHPRTGQQIVIDFSDEEKPSRVLP